MKKLVSSVIVASVFVLVSAFGVAKEADLGKTKVKPGDPQFNSLVSQVGVPGEKVVFFMLYKKPKGMAVASAIGKKDSTDPKSKNIVIKSKRVSLKN